MNSNDSESPRNKCEPTAFQILAEWAHAKVELKRLKSDLEKFPAALKRFKKANRLKKKLTQ